MDNSTVHLVISGHVDHGKSTLIGRLMYDTGSISEEKIAEVKAMSEESGEEFEFAFVMDYLEEERQNRITIDTAQIFFKTEKRRYVIIDTPGHKEFLKNMITGSSYADMAILIIDADEGVQEQTKRHCFMLDLLGFEEIFVAVNKMDRIDYKQERFDEVVEQIHDYAGNLNVKIRKCIPISAKEGVNIAEKSDKTDWYSGTSLLKEFDSYPVYKEQKTGLCFPIQDTYDFVKDYPIFVGRVESGTLNKDDKVIVLPGNVKNTISTILTYESDGNTRAETEQCVGIRLENPAGVSRGNVIVKNAAATVSKKIAGKLFWLSPVDCSLDNEYTFKCATQEVPCKISAVISKYDPAELEKKDADSVIRHAEIAEVELLMSTEVVTYPFDVLQELGRFVLEHNNAVVAGGIVLGC